MVKKELEKEIVVEYNYVDEGEKSVEGVNRAYDILFNKILGDSPHKWLKKEERNK